MPFEGCQQLVKPRVTGMGVLIRLEPLADHRNAAWTVVILGVDRKSPRPVSWPIAGIGRLLSPCSVAGFDGEQGRDMGGATGGKCRRSAG